MNELDDKLEAAKSELIQASLELSVERERYGQDAGEVHVWGMERFEAARAAYRKLKKDTA